MLYGKKYYTIDEVINAPTESKKVFIIASERKKTGECNEAGMKQPGTKNKTIGRYYTAFESFREFLDNRDDYPHCHEILVDHVNNVPNIAGRLVFDFDIKDTSNLPEDSVFKEQIEQTVYDVIDQYYTDVDTDVLVFIWSSTDHDNKMSKHLTVKNFHFDNWKSMMAIFYKFFCETWDQSYDWITSDKLVDSQIIRKSASLRMVGSKKIDGNVLYMDDDNHRFVDSLIRIYFPKHLKREQTITINNIKEEYAPLKNHQNGQKNTSAVRSEIIPSSYSITEEFQICFDLLNTVQPGVFVPHSMKGEESMTLRRLKPAPCLVSGIVHDNENAYVYMLYPDFSSKTVKNFYFVCYRNCNPNHKRICVCIGKDIDANGGYVGEGEHSDKDGFWKYVIPKSLKVNLS